MFKYALDLVFRRKLRTFLTSLGIMISVTLMTFILFGMSGLEGTLLSQFSSMFSPNQLTVTSQDFMSRSFMSAPTKDSVKEEPPILNQKVIDNILDIEGVEKVDSALMINGFDIYLEGDDIPYPNGYPAAYDAILYDDFLAGEEKTLEKGEVYISEYVASFYELSPEEIVGKNIVLKTSNTSVFTISSKNLLNKEYTFKVVGVVNSGSDTLQMSLADGLDILTDIGGYESSEEYIENAGYIQLYVTTDIEKTGDIENILVNDMNLSVISTKTFTEFISTITSALTLALVLFGGISAVVASIGIINTMIMSIYEQTKEIGVIKAIGASNIQVLFIFLIQSGIIGLIGGVLGLSISFGVMYLIDPYIVELLLEQGISIEKFFTFDLSIALLITVVSVLVGIFAGLYPAYRASRLNPVEALRHD